MDLHEFINQIPEGLQKLLYRHNATDRISLGTHRAESGSMCTSKIVNPQDDSSLVASGFLYLGPAPFPGV